MANATSSFEEKIKLLQISFIKELPARLNDLDVSISQLDSDPTDSSALIALTRKLHTLAGSGATFGLPEVTELARKGENLLKVKDIIENGVNSVTSKHIKEIVTALHNIKTDQLSETAHSANSEINALKKSLKKETNIKRCIYILENDKNVHDDIVNQFQQYGYLVTAFDNIDKFCELQKSDPADIVLIDLLINGISETKINQLITQSINNDSFTIVTCTSGDIKYRLSAARSNAHHFLIKPYDVSEIIDRIDADATSKKIDPYRVLIVDDSYELAKFYSLTLENEGFNSNYITKPLNILEAITYYQPELILLDLYMPDCTGLELASVIRQQEHYIDVPIVFLSSETDTKTQLLAMQQGGDDFLTKPIIAENLILSVKTRIDRYRQLKSLFVKDSLTGLHNHTSIKQHIETEILRAQRNRKQLCLVMIDVDHFKQVNDVHGHNAGDKVLKGLARLMRQRLRQTDILGRYGGDEFVVILPETEINDARSVINKLRLDFEKLQFTDLENEIAVSITCGIASYPPAKDSEHLSISADVALYKAKELGRNQVAIYENF
ncbi:MAG: diguanylate cyclase [Gammaproteobacteria bacterium]